MKVLVTGAKGFVGKNLCAQLRNIKDGKDRRFPDLNIEDIFEYDIDSTPEELGKAGIILTGIGDTSLLQAAETDISIICNSD